MNITKTETIKALLDDPKVETINLIETFKRFNKGRRRPDRKSHLRLCGFTLRSIFYSGEDIGTKPRDYAKWCAGVINESEKCPAHIVYIPSAKDANGFPVYEMWGKNLIALNKAEVND